MEVIRLYTLEQAERLIKLRRKRKIKRFIRQHIALYRQKGLGLSFLFLCFICQKIPLFITKVEEVKGLGIVYGIIGIMLILTRREVAN